MLNGTLILGKGAGMPQREGSDNSADGGAALMRQSHWLRRTSVLCDFPVRFCGGDHMSLFVGLLDTMCLGRSIMNANGKSHIDGA